MMRTTIQKKSKHCFDKSITSYLGEVLEILYSGSSYQSVYDTCDYIKCDVYLNEHQNTGDECEHHIESEQLQ